MGWISGKTFAEFIIRGSKQKMGKDITVKEEKVKPVRKITKEDTLRSLTGVFTHSLEKFDITPERIARKLNEELEATRVKFFYDSKTGEVINSGEYADWKTRQTARQDACKLLNLIPTPEVKKEDKNYVINFYTQIIEAADPLKKPNE